MHHIVMLGEAYGGWRFWFDVLLGDENVDNLRKALMYFGCGSRHHPLVLIRRQLKNVDSRVRAWACFALGRAKDVGAKGDLLRLSAIDVPRVRRQARHALRKIGHPRVTRRAQAVDSRLPLRRVLISDQEGNWSLFARMLRPHGYRLSFAVTAEETMLKALRRRPFAIITNNLKCGDNTAGLRMTEALVGNQRLAETLVIMCTLDDGLEPVFLWRGGDRFISKPPVLQEMLSALGHEPS